MHIQKMQGTAWSRQHNALLPVMDVYDEIMSILNGNNIKDDDPKAKEKRSRAADYKGKIMGRTALKRAPIAYWDVGLVVEAGIVQFSEWKEYDLEDKAIYMAHRFLKNAIEVINAHYNEQDRIAEKNAGENGEDT